MTDILDTLLAEMDARKAAAPANERHGAIAEKLCQALLEKANRFKLGENPKRVERGEEPYKLSEVKQFEIVSYGNQQTFVTIEIGMIGDEGTAAQAFCRDYRHISIAKNGGLTLLNAKRKRESLGFFWAVHGLTK